MYCFLGAVILALAREAHLLLADIDVDRATRTLNGKVVPRQNTGLVSVFTV